MAFSGWAGSVAAAGRSRSANFTSGSRDSSVMSSPPNVTASGSGRSRLPPHAGQSWPVMYCSARRFICGLCVVAKLCSTCRRALVNVPR